MAPPPAKRQKRHVVLSSEDEDVPTPPSKNVKAPTRASTRDKSRLAHSNGVENRSLPTRSRTKESSILKQRPGQSPSPERSKRKTGSSTSAKGPLHTFFKPASEALPVQKQSKTENFPPTEEDVEEDIIEDDSAEETSRLRKPPTKSEKHGTARMVLDRRKPLQEQTQNSTITASQEKRISASQRFLTMGKSSGKEASTQTVSTRVAPDARPWAERYGPTDLEDLMVHKKKVADVRGWLERVLQGRNHKRLLILKGPSGAGKTATISTLAKDMGVDISEWKNPVDTDFSSESYLSMSAQFEDFLGRSGRFGSLTFSQDDTEPQPQPLKHPPPPSENNTKKLILMEEFPNTFTSTSLALRAFRTSVLQFLASNTSSAMSAHPTSMTIRPLIMIITETTSSTSHSDNFTAHRLLGPFILSHPATTILEFNPIAPTLLLKALDVVLQKEARHSSRRRIPGPAVLKQLAELGDVRSAIGSLEFLYLRGGDADDWSGRIASKSKKGTAAMSKMEQRTLELVSQRESTLGLFHAVGKVVYNKREESTSTNRPSQPPDHLPQHARLKVSEVAVDALIDETGTDPRTFIAALHENYVPSCEGASITDSLNDCIDALSDADLLTTDHGGRENYQTKIAEELRQDEIAFQIAVRGLLFALPHPVKRATHPVKGGGNRLEAFKMRYPMSMRLARQMEQMEELMERWSSRAGDERSLSGRCTASNEELLLERLPYIAKIERKKGDSRGGNEVEKITTFRGMSSSTEEQSDDDELAAETARDRNAMPPPAMPGDGLGVGGRNPLLGAATQLEDGVEKLWLSEDDIEDE